MATQKPSQKKRNNKESDKAAPSRRRPFLILAGVLGAAGVAAAGACAWRYQGERGDADAVNSATGAGSSVSGGHQDVGEALPKFVVCLAGIDVTARSGVELGKRLAAGSEGQYATLGRRIKEECTPVFRQQLAAVRPRFLAAPSLAAQWKSFDAAALILADSADEYAGRLQLHADVDAANHAIVDQARKWSAKQLTGAESARFESFLACAVPDAAIRLDKTALARWVSPQCASTAAAQYMERVRAECAPRLSADAVLDKPTGGTGGAGGAGRTGGAGRAGGAGGVGGVGGVNETAALAAIQEARVLNQSLGLATYLFTVCAEKGRRDWTNADGAALLRAYDIALATQNTLATTVIGLKQKLAGTPAP